MTPQRSKNTYKLSPIQEGMLFHHLNAKNSGIDIEQIICSLAEPVQIEPLKSAWRQIADRHDVLRTSFHWQDRDEPSQEVHRTVELPFDVTDMSKLSRGQQAGEFANWLHQDRVAGFQLDRAPLFRLNLFRLAENEWTLVWTLHHAILDGRSFPIVLSEVFRTYDAQLKGTGVDLPAGRPYSDYIEFLNSLDVSLSEKYWRGILKGFASSTPLTALESATGERGHGEEQIQLSPEASKALAELASRERFTVNNAVQAAWAVVLNRYSGSSDIVFGSTRACRSFLPRAGSMVGTFINTLPVRVKVTDEHSIFELLRQIRASQIEVRDYEHTPLTRIQSWSELAPGSSLFESILVFDHAPLNSQMKSAYLNWENRKVTLQEHTNFPITLYANSEPELTLRIAYDRSRFSRANIQRALEHLRIVLEEIATGVDKKTAELRMLTQPERIQLIETWNDTAADYPHHQRIHDSIEARGRRSADDVAVIFRDQQITYGDLNRRADQLAGFLTGLGVKPDTKVGIHMRRSIDTVVALLAVLKSGGAYVPLDPSYPSDRIQFIIDDARVAVILTEQNLRDKIQAGNARVVALDSEWGAIADSEPVHPEVFGSDQIAYVIYTSGSTGKPKGVMVSHRNVMNFFAGIDQKLGADPGVWLANTSISFDISVLELFWTLSRGFRVILQEENKTLPDSSAVQPQAPARPVDFSLFYFASDESQSGSKYDLLLEGAKFADQHGFTAVWTPERHFHAFGGLFPNPSVVSAALAMVTKNIQIRAGSVVLPLHDPIRVAEEWAVVDQLSQGRVGLSFASGWHDRDFVFAPDDYQDRKKVMARDLEQVRALWRGEKITRRSGSGKDVQVSVCPRPVQPELPVWITAGGDPNTFRAAGETGANLLTHLLGQTTEELKEKIAIYRKAIQEKGGDGHVTLMLHTFVGNSQEEVKNTVREPLSNYLKSSVDLMKQVARGLGEELGSTPLNENDLTALIDHGFERYYQTSGLFGTPETCLATIQKLQAIGVDEIACLVDFGIDSQTVLANLGNLQRLLELTKQRQEPEPQGYSIPEQIARHHVTHLQCTPSLARMLVDHDAAREAIGSLQKLLVGGEALPLPLAQELLEAGPQALWNMYGPTETTIWSTMERVEKGVQAISIGRPIANTKLFVLNENRQMVPAGVAGELYIGGESVARGYWNRPELTSERFVEIALDKKAERVYRTGDLVRYLSDGRLEFLGRVDNQVKIRGHRIELGEIETMLCAHPKVEQAIVSATEDATGDKALAAYVISTDGEAVSVPDLRSFLGEKLPAAMVPNAFVPMEAFPLTPNSKVDRNRLPKPQAARVIEEQKKTRPQEQPADELEAKLAEVWCSVLDLPSIGVEDDFFEAGGHSLKAVRLFSAIKSKFKVELPLATLLHSPTVRSIARTLRDSQVQEEQRSAIVALQPKGSKPPLFCIGALDGELILFRQLIAELGEDQPIYGIQPTDLRHDPAMLLDVRKIAGYYIDQLHAANHQRPYCLMGYSFGGLVALEMAQQLRAKGVEVPATVLIDTHYFAGCKRNEGMGERLNRYKHHVQEACKSSSGLGLLTDRMKHASRSVVYRAASTKTLGGVIEVEADITKIQQCAGDSYRAKPYPGNVCVFKATTPLPFFEGGPKIGWDGIFNDNASIYYEIPGDHGTINTAKNTGLMARRLNEFLGGVESRTIAPVLTQVAS